MDSPSTAISLTSSWAAYSLANQQANPARLQRDFMPSPFHYPLEQVELEIGHCEVRFHFGAARTPRKRPYAGDQLGESKGFHHIIVAAGVKTRYAIVDPRHRG